MTAGRVRRHQQDDVVPDLVEYLVVALPGLEALSTFVAALVQVVDSAAIRVLDLVVVMKDPEGTVTSLELDAVASLAPLRGLVANAGRMLSQHDVGLVSFAVEPGSAGLVLVTEDRWAEPLSAAALGVGGRIVAGERVPAARVESALAEQLDVDGGGA